MQTLHFESPLAAVRHVIGAVFLAVALLLVSNDVAAAEPLVESITGVIVDDVTVQTDRYPSRVVTIAADDGNTYLVATVGGLTPDGEYLLASHAARLPVGYKVALEIAPAPEARLADFEAGGYTVGAGEVLYQVNGAEDGETILHKVEGVGDDKQQLASAALRASYDDFELHWEAFPVPIYLNARGGPVSATQQIDAAKMAVSMWNTITCSDLRVRFAGTTSIPGSRTSNNGVNMIYWDADYFVKSGHPSRLGETWRRFDPNTWVFDDVEIVLNSGQTITHPGGSSTYDLVTIMAHELGHGLGFPHVAEENNFMTTFLSKDLRIRSLGQADAKHVNYLYPGTCSGNPNLSSRVAVSRISCFGPSGSTSDTVEIIVESPEESSGFGDSLLDPVTDDTGSNPTDIPVETFIDGQPPPNVSDPPDVVASSESTASGLVEKSDQGTALAISSATSDDPSGDFYAWEGTQWDEEDWNQELKDLVLSNWFAFSPD